MVGDVVEQHGYTMPAYLRAGCHKHMKRALTHLRLSNAPIEVNTQSYAIPYSDRVCSRCNSLALDEHHLLFECGFTSHIRSRPEHSRLLGKCSNIRELMQLAYSSTIDAPCMLHSIFDSMSELNHRIGLAAGPDGTCE
jgi:hypothetical protein